MSSQQKSNHHAAIVKKIRDFFSKQNAPIKDESRFLINEFLEEFPEIRELCRRDIFRWESIPGDDDQRLKDYLIKAQGMSWAVNGILEKDTNLIKLKEGRNSLELILNEDEEIVTVFYNKKEIQKLILRKEKGKLHIYAKEYDFSLDSNLPIDLICRELKVEHKKKNYYYTIFFVASTELLPGSLEKAMQFYNFYLSGIINSDFFQIVLVHSENTKITPSNKAFLKRNGFGLWLLKNSHKDPEYTIHSYTQKKMISGEIEKILAKNDILIQEPILNQLSDSIKTHNDYVYNNVIGIQLEQFGKGYIDRKLLNSISNLKKVEYRSILLDFVAQQLTEKNDEYEFANEVFSHLWSEYLGLQYTEFLKKFEPALQFIFAETHDKNNIIYRDHYLHQFQVFLLGLAVIDENYELFESKYERPELCWLIAASFHDIAYPAEKYHYWVENCFDMVCKLTKQPVETELKSKFVDEEILSSLGYLICEYCRVYEGIDELKLNWLKEKNEHIQFFYKNITEERNHGVLSCISLLKMIQKEENRKTIEKKFKGKKPTAFEYALNKIFLPGCLAISLHDKKIWENKFKEIEFDTDPLSFLLIFCDTVHEWGRPSKIEETEEIYKGLKFYLKDFDCKNNKVEINLWTPDCEKNHDFFKYKQEEIKKVEHYLKQNQNLKFVIHLKDKNNEGEDYSMKGKSR